MKISPKKINKRNPYNKSETNRFLAEIMKLILKNLKSDHFSKNIFLFLLNG